MIRDPDLERLRRLPLVTALVVLTWTLAGVALDSPARVAPLGLPLVVTRPELLPIGLVFGALYGAVRYYYYALMLADSPYRIRRDLLNSLWAEQDKKPGLAGMYWGPVEFISTPWYSNSPAAEAVAQRITAAWPKFFRSRVVASVKQEMGISQHDGSEYSRYAAAAKVPRQCRLAALAHDLDYTSPAWLPIVVSALYMIRVLRGVA